MRALRRFLSVFLLFPVAMVLASEVPTGQPHQPKLVLVLVIDQMRADYLDRFEDLFGEGGFKLLMKNGADFTNCTYDYGATSTAPGHSTILSGIPVRRSGIVGNEWFDREKRRSIYCVEDLASKSVGINPENTAGKVSPKNFHGTTIGDELLAISPSSRVFGISVKDRGAVLLAGQHPTGAFWFDSNSGNWITSTHYTRSLPSWVEEFNARRVAEGFLGRRWTRALPDSCYVRVCADDTPGEGALPGEKRPVFPHAIRALAGSGVGASANSTHRFDALLSTPYGDEVTLDFVETAIDAEELGRRGAMDLLAVSFSSPDYCGHLFGPDSQEMEDVYVRLDRNLQDLFTFVDSRIGLQNVVIVLTADHGVAPLPELQVATGASRINPKDLLRNVKASVGQEFNYDEGNGNLVLSLLNNFIYLDVTGISAHGFDLNAFENAVKQAASKERGILRCYTRSELKGLLKSDEFVDSLGVRIAKSFNEERSGDIALLTKEYSIFSEGMSGTTHGSPYEYDRHVPLLFFGPGITPGRYSAACRPNDIAPTLAELLRLPIPAGSDGKVLGMLPIAGQISPDAAAPSLK